MKNLIQDIRNCALCAKHLELGPRPVLAASKSSKVIIIGQAPGTVVHKSGVPWEDKSGKNLRTWMEIGNETFYNEEKVALIPMGFCYPGKGKSGDLPPRPECAPKWHPELFQQLRHSKLILLIGKYAQDHYLGKTAKRTLTETVKNFEDYLPKYFVLPHPSPRNNIWQAKNPWFKFDVIPALRSEIRKILP
ncbi:MAG: uracil-DNA glycosylase family protein [Flavobacteriales bacterium]|nr:uracil-DNA glycosylase family protein [Flavobacteriales bacterium]